jgi:hypothetical protein
MNARNGPLEMERDGPLRSRPDLDTRSDATPTPEGAPVFIVPRRANNTTADRPSRPVVVRWCEDCGAPWHYRCRRRGDLTLIDYADSGVFVAADGGVRLTSLRAVA